MWIWMWIWTGGCGRAESQAAATRRPSLLSAQCSCSVSRSRGGRDINPAAAQQARPGGALSHSIAASQWLQLANRLLAGGASAMQHEQRSPSIALPIPTPTPPSHTHPHPDHKRGVPLHVARSAYGHILSQSPTAVQKSNPQMAACSRRWAWRILINCHVSNPAQ
jgi:hypothetical protein